MTLQSLGNKKSGMSAINEVYCRYAKQKLHGWERNLSAILLEKFQKEECKMTEIKVKNLEELKDVVKENLKEGTIVSIDLSGEEDAENDESNGM